jgi:hypothetical protein
MIDGVAELRPHCFKMKKVHCDKDASSPGLAASSNAWQANTCCIFATLRSHQTLLER